MHKDVDPWSCKGGPTGRGLGSQCTRDDLAMACRLLAMLAWRVPEKVRFEFDQVHSAV